MAAGHGNRRARSAPMETTMIRSYAAGLDAAGWLSLGAAPTFALMALLSGMLGGGSYEMLCAPGHGGSVMTGMVPMYLLMSAFHLAPWLRLVAGRRVCS